MSLKASSNDASQLYRFKDIVTVPGAMDLIDIVLSMTQRKTPTEVHPQYDIRRIRTFYMRKVKYCQSTFHDKLNAILDQFPKIDDIHPFYADLCNVLYDKDHYKIALGQVNSVRHVVDMLAKEYVRLLKYADSPYKCKMLKRAALGRICTTIRKLKASLSYLEEVRKHLSRLPGINPFHQTVLLGGFPNVGKSTFMNVLSNANVEVADWSFTTKSLYVGHFDYQYQRWQVIDTPGVLDRPLSARNTIELTAITAMAHLSAAILFLVDISESCGHSIMEQVQLFHSLRPLLQHKPVVVCLNKTDLREFTSLKPEEVTAIQNMAQGYDLIDFVACSTLKQINLDDAKNKACDMLNALKRQKRLLAGRSASSTALPAIGADIVSQLYIPKVSTSSLRQPVDKSSLDSLSQGNLKKADPVAMTDGEKLLSKDHMEIEGGAGVYNADPRKDWLLENEEWRYDEVPEIFNGKNVADFIDPDIDEKIKALEEEEAALDAAWDKAKHQPTSEWYEAQEALYEVYVEREARRLMKLMKTSTNDRIQARKWLDKGAFRERLDAMGIDADDILVRIEKEIIPKSQAALMNAKQPVTTDLLGGGLAARRNGKVSRLARAYNLTDVAKKRKLEKDIVRVNKRYVKPKKNQTRDQICESDRFIGTKKPKHLYTGKRSNGKTDWR